MARESPGVKDLSLHSPVGSLKSGMSVNTHAGLRRVRAANLHPYLRARRISGKSSAMSRCLPRSGHDFMSGLSPARGSDYVR